MIYAIAGVLLRNVNEEIIVTIKPITNTVNAINRNWRKGMEKIFLLDSSFFNAASSFSGAVDLFVCSTI